MTQSGESETLRKAMFVVLGLIEVEDTDGIRRVIEEAGIAPGVHVGEPPESFAGDKVKTTEYVLGQWAEGIDSKTPFLNSFRNITLAWRDEGRLLV